MTMNADQKLKADQASEEELWQLHADPSTGEELRGYVRQRLKNLAGRMVETEAVRKLEALTTQVKGLEERLKAPSQPGRMTFLLALSAAVFSSFAVPWDEVKSTAEGWGQQVRKFLDQPPPRSATSRSVSVASAEVRPSVSEVKLPEIPAPALAETHASDGPMTPLLPPPGQMVWRE
ncbi:MAG TPA: hypothetical protein VGE29_00220 [Prosthecobacter sp.]